MIMVCMCVFMATTCTYLSHWRNVHDAMIHSETMNTSRTVPGHMVMSVFKTNLKMCIYKEKKFNTSAWIKGVGAGSARFDIFLIKNKYVGYIFFLHSNMRLRAYNDVIEMNLTCSLSKRCDQYRHNTYMYNITYIYRYI